MSLLGWGSEMFPKEEPLCRRAAFRRLAPRRQILATVSRIPSSSPGKKPASTAKAGNLLQCAVRGVTVVFGDGEDEVDGVANGTVIAPVEAGMFEEVGCVEEGADDELDGAED
jgi:hypothetical protein